MNTLKHKIERTAFAKAFDVAYDKMGKDRQHELKKMFDMAKPYIDQTDVVIDYEKAEEMIMNEDGALVKYIDRFVGELDKNVLKTAVLNFGFEAMFCGTKVMEDAREKYQCNVPWLILMDPTSACNLHCTGCWAAEYGNKLNLSFEDMDDLITQGKELGIFFYMYTGGEPLVRKDDLIKICEKHRDCAFIAFTNGTLVDQAF